MNPIDSMMADVFTACNSDLHGRPGRYYISGVGSGVAMSIVIKPDNQRSIFDTGTAEIDFNVIQGLIGANDLSSVPPKEQGRGGPGDVWIFNDTTNVRWHIRNLGASSEQVGAYYDVVLSDATSPIAGV